MIADWMLHAIVVSGCLGVGAYAAERLAVARHLPRRSVWSAALLGGVLLPLVRLTPPLRVPDAARMGAEAATATPTASVMRLPTWTVGAAPVRHESAWIGGWTLLSLLVAWRVLLARRALRRLLREASPAVLGGETVWIVPDGTPALVGLRAPQIVVPAWLRDADSSLQRLVVLHEREHRVAGDAWLVHATALLLVLFPWNVALWPIAARLRRAIELDCDARVLARHPDATRYGRLLLLIAQHRTRGAGIIAPALGEPVTLTEERIMAITRPTRPGPLASTIALGVTLLAVGTACTAEQAVDPETSAPADAIAAMSTAPQDVAIDTVPADATPPLDVRAAGDTVFFEFLVDQPSRVVDGAKAPVFPAAERARGESGEVLVQYVVDRAGVPDMSTFKVLRSSGDAFSDAVREAVATLRHHPAERDGKPVSQLVQQPFAFRISR